jgi:hypothetical protein
VLPPHKRGFFSNAAASSKPLKSAPTARLTGAAPLPTPPPAPAQVFKLAQFVGDYQMTAQLFDMAVIKLKEPIGGGLLLRGAAAEGGGC